MRAVTLLLVTVTSAMLSAQGQQYIGVEQRTQIFTDFSRPTEPFSVLGNIHYVGAQNIAAYLFTNPEGHILIDTGTSLMQAQLAGNIEKLGFKTSDIKIMLSSHAHVDHVQGHAYMKRVTGAQVMAIAEDAKALEAGTDISPIAWEGWEPVKVDRVLEHDDTVEIGATTLRAVHNPGRTQGTTTWMMTVEDGGGSYNVAFLGSMGPNAGVALHRNPQHKNVIADSRLGLSRLKAEKAPNIILPNHAQSSFAGKIEQIKAGVRPHPLLNGHEWTSDIVEAETNLEITVDAEKQGS